MRFNSRFLQGFTALIAATAFVAPAQGGMFGSPKFTMKQSDDRFRADGLTTISSDGNRISKKSIAGGTHIDKEGVFLNPSVTLRRNTGEIAYLYLYMFNVSERISDIGAPNSFGRPLRVSFLTGEGTPIVLPIERGEQSFGEPRCTRMAVAACTTSLIEHGIVPITIDQYRRLMAARALAIKVDGTDRSRIYEVPEIAPTFLQNLTTFYSAHLAPTPSVR